MNKRNFRQVYITPEMFRWHFQTGSLYEGFVIGEGYAWVSYNCMFVQDYATSSYKTITNLHTSTGISYEIQHLDNSPECIALSLGAEESLLQPDINELPPRNSNYEGEVWGNNDRFLFVGTIDGGWECYYKGIMSRKIMEVLPEIIIKKTEEKLILNRGKYPKLNHFFSYKSSYRKNFINYSNLNKDKVKKVLASEWILDNNSTFILNTTKKIMMDKLFKYRSKGLTPEKKGYPQEISGKFINKMSDVEIKYRINNYLLVEGYDWYGDVWYNLFTKDITKIDFQGISAMKTFFFFTNESTIESAMFLKSTGTILYVEEMCKGIDCQEKFLKSYISTEELEQHINLPTQNYDIRN